LLFDTKKNAMAKTILVCTSIQLENNITEKSVITCNYQDNKMPLHLPSANHSWKIWQNTCQKSWTIRQRNVTLC